MSSRFNFSYHWILHDDIRCASQLAICLSGHSLLHCSVFNSQRPHFCLAVTFYFLLVLVGIPVSQQENTHAFHALKERPLLRRQSKFLAKTDSIKHNTDSRLGFPLHTITGFHRPSLTHYYGFICHLTPTLNLGLPLEFRPLTKIKFRCQASPVTALAPC
jgi:hypothetical protein